MNRRLVLACMTACSTTPRPAPTPAKVVPQPVEADAQTDPRSSAPEDNGATPPGEDAGPAEPFHYLDGISKRRVSRILKEASVGASTEITTYPGSDDGVTKDWRLAILDGDTDVPLAGGDITLTRVDKRVTMGVVKLSVSQLQGHTRVRMLPPKPAVPASPAPPSGAPHHVARIEIHYSWGTMHCSNEHSYAIGWTGSEYRSGTTRVDAKLVDALDASLTGLTSSVVEQTCTGHTDDYPEFEIAWGEDPSTPAVVLTSASNCGPDNAPWNVVRGGKRFVQTSGPIGDAVHALLESIDPVRWKPSQDPRFNWYMGCDPPHR